ncbi:MAG: hypothetical protein VYC33_03460 [Candidatus Thermoplasmatota archaeon]|nr:hypothetical protein [Candidatus Thermoplasmatota archaeon]
MDIFEGRISSSGFASGDRIVIGDWKKSPLGAFTNVMWAKPDGTRVLLSPSQKHADYVSALYNFEEVHITRIEVIRQSNSIEIKAPPLDIKLNWGMEFGLQIPRPRWFISTVEQWFAKIFFGTSTHGLTCNGLREWYCIYSLSKIKHATAVCEGVDLGNPSNFEINACFGFSEPPKKPSSVRLRSIIESVERLP